MSSPQPTLLAPSVLIFRNLSSKPAMTDHLSIVECMQLLYGRVGRGADHHHHITRPEKLPLVSHPISPIVPVIHVVVGCLLTFSYHHLPHLNGQRGEPDTTTLTQHPIPPWIEHSITEVIPFHPVPLQADARLHPQRGRAPAWPSGGHTPIRPNVILHWQMGVVGLW